METSQNPEQPRNDAQQQQEQQQQQEHESEQTTMQASDLNNDTPLTQSEYSSNDSQSHEESRSEANTTINHNNLNGLGTASDIDRSFVDNINSFLRQTADRFRNNHEDGGSNNDSNNDTNRDTSTTESTNTGGSTETTNGAIIITVNYIFSDENDPSNPNRTGSLVLTLPNNSANQDPRTIEELIRLATQMAYTSIINGRHQEKGLSLEKFQSFPSKSLDEINSHECSICLENFIDVNTTDTLKNLEESGSRSKKRRKLNDMTSSSISGDSGLQTDQDGSERDESDHRTSHHRDHENENPNRSKLLASAGIEFSHVPVEMPCGHIFGQSCLSEWLKSHTTCPLCRTAISNPRAGIDSSNDQNSTDQSDSTTTNNLNFTGLNIPGLNSEGVNSNRNNNTTNSNLDTDGDNSRGFSNIRFVGPNGFDEFLNLFNPRQDQRPEGETTSRNPRVLSDLLGRANRDFGNNNRDSNPSSSSSMSGPSVFSNILTYFRRRQPESNSLFPVGVASRRTNNGIESSEINGQSMNSDFGISNNNDLRGERLTRSRNEHGLPVTGSMTVPVSEPRQTDTIRQEQNNADDILDFMNLRSLTDDAPHPTSASSTDRDSTPAANPTNNEDNEDHTQ